MRAPAISVFAAVGLVVATLLFAQPGHGAAQAQAAPSAIWVSDLPTVSWTQSAPAAASILRRSLFETQEPESGLATGDPVQGKELYAQHCARCHGARAEGGQGERLAGTRFSLAEVIQIVRTPRGMMASFTPEELSDQQIAHIYAYLQSLGAEADGQGP